MACSFFVDDLQMNWKKEQAVCKFKGEKEVTMEEKSEVMTCSFFGFCVVFDWKKEQAGGELEGGKEGEFECEMEEKRQKLKVDLVKKEQRKW